MGSFGFMGSFCFILWCAFRVVPEALAQKQPFLLSSLQAAQRGLFLQERWTHRDVRPVFAPSPTTAGRLFRYVSRSTEQGHFPLPPLPPWLGCRTHQSGADDVRESMKRKVMDSCSFGLSGNWKHNGSTTCWEDIRVSLIGTDTSSKPWTTKWAYRWTALMEKDFLQHLPN